MKLLDHARNKLLPPEMFNKGVVKKGETPFILSDCVISHRWLWIKS
jgi:hypothetical protein